MQRKLRFEVAVYLTLFCRNRRNVIHDKPGLSDQPVNHTDKLIERMPDLFVGRQHTVSLTEYVDQKSFPFHQQLMSQFRHEVHIVHIRFLYRRDQIGRFFIIPELRSAEIFQPKRCP